MQQKFKPFPVSPGENILGVPSLLLPPLVGNANGLSYSSLLEVTPTLGERWSANALNLAIYVRYQQTALYKNKAGYLALGLKIGELAQAEKYALEVVAFTGAGTKERAEANLAFHAIVAELRQAERELKEYGQAQALDLLAEPVFRLGYRLERQSGELIGIGDIDGDTVQIEPVGQEKPTEHETISFIGRILISEQLLQLQTPAIVEPAESLKLTIVIRSITQNVEGEGSITYANVASIAVAAAAITFTQQPLPWIKS